VPHVAAIGAGRVVGVIGASRSRLDPAVFEPAVSEYSVEPVLSGNAAEAVLRQIGRSKHADDGGVGEDLVGRVPGKVRRVTCDGAYDSRALYDAASSRGAKIVVPSVRTAQTGCRGCRGCRARDRIVRRIRKAGRRQWKKESGNHRQARAENTFMRYRLMLGDRLHARDADAQSVEARLACNILNRMADLAVPASYAVRM
jgi:hypothetical protein